MSTLERKVPEWCEKAMREWSFDPNKGHTMSEIMTACSYIFEVWLTYNDYRPRRGMQGTRRNCQETFASKFFEIYRKCKEENRNMIFDDFRDMDIAECH